MPPSKSRRGRYGTKKLILDLLGESPGGLNTGQLVTKVRAAAGQKIPYPTVFQAAKSLVKERSLSSSRDGREYRFAATARTAKPIATEPETASSAAGLRSAGPPGPGATLASAHPVDSFPHRLDLGQMLVLSHDGKTVVTLTNVHGRAQIERLKVP